MAALADTSSESGAVMQALGHLVYAAREYGGGAEIESHVATLLGEFTFDEIHLL